MAIHVATASGQPTAVRPGGLNWLGLGALLLVAVVVGGLAGFALSGGFARMSDESFIDRGIAAWSTNDQAVIAADYAPDAVFQDMDGGERYVGVEAIQDYVAFIDTLGFVVERAGPTIRFGEYLITPVRYGAVGDLASSIGIVRVEDGRITYHSGYSLPAPSP